MTTRTIAKSKSASRRKFLLAAGATGAAAVATAIAVFVG